MINPGNNRVSNNILKNAALIVELDILNTLALPSILITQSPSKDEIDKIGNALADTDIHVIINSNPNALFKTGVLDFPVYLLHHKGPLLTPKKEIISTLGKYGFKNDSSYEHAGIVFRAANEWELETHDGFTAPSDINRFQKVCFVKADKLADYNGDFEIVLANLIKHELGHAFGILSITLTIIL